jgi:hypothetical protein
VWRWPRGSRYARSSASCHISDTLPSLTSLSLSLLCPLRNRAFRV